MEMGSVGEFHDPNIRGVAEENTHPITSYTDAGEGAWSAGSRHAARPLLAGRPRLPQVPLWRPSQISAAEITVAIGG